ncbi:SRPBCC family protein [Streptomyces sp. NPDC003077]|uniref:SRPBCC family protein n=1 Tax=Streptomyces sp. NPDC003077 TaxID=3154443 RepID=UPI0033B165EE
MSHRLRPVEPDFAETAPLRLVFAAEIAAPPAAVYTALAGDVAGWSHWFTWVAGAAPTAGGLGRQVRLTGGAWFTETVLAAEAGEHYVCRAEATNVPGMLALLEDWRLVPAGGGTRVRWLCAADGRPAFRFALTLARPALGRAFRASMHALDRYVG